jgi:uncharacterized protein (TIGR00369 family)
MSEPTHDDETQTPASTPGAALMRQFLPTSPFVGHLGMRLVDVQPGRATLALPFAPELITMAGVVHGGAIASLIDVAGMVAAWSDAEVTGNPRGSTVALTVNYLAPANNEDLQATATVLRRGRSLVYLDIEVHGASGNLVAKGLATYKIG